MSISFSGLASGLDTSSWVESLVALKKAKVTTLEEEKKEVQSLQETLSQIKSFFSSFRSMLEKVTDAKFGVASMDLFAQNLATSSNLEALTASATTEAEEATYNVLVDKLASETKANSNYSYMTTIVQTTTATGDSKLINLGVKAGNIGVKVNGVEHGISITENDTLSTFIEKLKNIGVNASYNEDSGIFSIDVGKDDINDIDNTGIKDALHLNGVNEGYQSNNLQTSKTDTIFSAATESTKLSELNVKAGVVTITANGKNTSITISDTTTLGDFIKALNDNNIEATLDKDGIFTISDAEITNEGNTDIKNALGLDSSIYGKSQTTSVLQHKTTITQTTTATSATLLKDLEGGKDIKDGDTIIVKDSNNESKTITITNASEATLGTLIEELENAGLYAAIKNDGTVEITGGTITGGTLDVEKLLGLQKEPYTAIVTGKPLTETVETHKIVDLQTKLVDDLKVKEGYLEVTDADGNKFYEKIYSGQTIADFMTDMGNLGINTKLDETTGILTITGGAFKTLSDADVQALVASATIVEPDSRYHHGTNLLSCLYGADTISTDQITVASTYSKTKALRHTVTNTINATKNTTLEKLGLSADGTAIFDVRGESRTINLTQTMTISDLMNQLKDAGIGSSFDEDTSRLTIENATITGGTSNLADILDLTTTISGKYVTSSELYTSDTIIIDATRDTLLKDYGISSTMSEADRTVTIYNSNGSVAATTVVGEGTTIGNLIDFINEQNGISANLKDGFLTIHNGYIENAALETAMGLSTSNKTSYVLGSIMTVTTTAAVTGETTLSSIFGTIGTLDLVKDGYNLKFNDKDISVSASTTLNELINAIYENGGTASLDHTGRLSVEGGTLTGSVAQALGITSYTHTSSVSATGEKLYVTDNVYANRDTTLKDLGVTGQTSYTIYNSLGQATTTINLENTATIGDFLDGLKANGIDGIIANGVIKLDSAEGSYIQGELATTLGLATQTVTEVVSTTQMSTAQVKHTATLNADLKTTMGELGVAAPDNVFDIYDKNDNLLASFTITDDSTTIEDFFNNLKAYDIVGSINNGVISLYSPNGNYVSGTLADKLGIATEAGENRTMTVGTTVTSTIAVTYTQDVKATEDSLISDYIATFPQDTTTVVDGVTTPILGTLSSTIVDKNGTVLGTINVDKTTTFGELFRKLGEYGIDADLHDGVIKLTSTSGNIIQGALATELGLNTETIVTTKTVGASIMSTAAVTYTSTLAATGTTRLNSILGYKIDGTITASGVTGTVIGISTAQDLVNLSKLVNSGKSMTGKTFVMTDDIDMSGISSWTPIGDKLFGGNFDGQGHTISNIDLTNAKTDSNVVSLFGIIHNNTIKNITLDNVVCENTSTSASSNRKSLSFIAYYAVGSTISNVNVKNTSISNLHCDGLVNATGGDVTIENSSVAYTWRGDTSKGNAWIVSGILGAADSGSVVNISGCSVDIDASGTIFLGSGIVGLQGQSGNTTYNISNCYVTGSITSDRTDSINTALSGIIGIYSEAANVHSNINISHCYVDVALNAAQGYVNRIGGGNFTSSATSNYITVNANNVLYNDEKSCSVTNGYSGIFGIGSYQKNGNYNPDNSFYSFSGNAYSSSSNTMSSLGFNSSVWDTTSKTLRPTTDYTLDIKDSNNEIVNRIDFTGKTLNDVVKTLSAYGSCTISDDGVLTFASENGYYIEGILATKLGISKTVTDTTTTTIGNTMTSTVAITYTATNTATMTSKLGDVVNSIFVDGTISDTGVTGSVIAISTVQDLVNLAALSQSNDFRGKTFVLTDDIDMSSVTNWQMIGGTSAYFAGTFDGQGHTISGLTMDVNSGTNGLFKYLNNATVRNLNLDSFTYNATNTSSNSVFIGALAGQVLNKSEISNVIVSNFKLNATGTYYMGGLAGLCSGATISNCAVDGSADGNWTGYVGGIVGGLIDNSTISASKTSFSGRSASSQDAHGGGIAGYVGLHNAGDMATITNCLSSGDIKCNIQGGLVARVYTYGSDISATFNVTNCVANNGNIPLIFSIQKGFDNTVGNSNTTVNITNSFTVGELVGLNESAKVNINSSKGSIAEGDFSSFAKSANYDTTIWNLGEILDIRVTSSPYSFCVYDPENGNTLLDTTLDASSTIGDVITVLQPYGNVSFVDGKLSFEGNDGCALVGNLPTSLGMRVTESRSTVTVGKTVTSTVGITYTETITATTSTTLDTIAGYKIDGSITADGVTGTVIGISTAQDLVNLAALSQSNNFRDKTFVLTDDIDMSSVTNWQLIGCETYIFKGNFDGQGHTISGLTMTIDKRGTGESLRMGLFYDTQEGSKFQNLRLKDFKFTGYNDDKTAQYVGALAATGNGFVKNVEIENFTADLQGHNIAAGGIFGWNWGASTITNCSTSGTIQGDFTGTAGGLAGIGGDFDTLYCKLKSSMKIFSVGDDSESVSGGIIGYYEFTTYRGEGTISDCYFDGVADGGIIGVVLNRTSGAVSSLNINNCIAKDKNSSFWGGIMRGVNCETPLDDNTKININNCYVESQASKLIKNYNEGVDAHFNFTNSYVETSGANKDKVAQTLNPLIWDTENLVMRDIVSTDPYSLYIVDSKTGNSLLDTTLSASSTIGDVIKALQPYGTVSFNDGVLSFNGNNGAILSGSLAEAFGITVQTNGTTTLTSTQTIVTTTTQTAITTTTIGNSLTSSKGTINIVATGSTQLSKLYDTSAYTSLGLFLYNENTSSIINVSTSAISTVQDLVDVLSNYGTATFTDGRLKFNSSSYAILDDSTLSKLGKTTDSKTLNVGLLFQTLTNYTKGAGVQQGSWLNGNIISDMTLLKDLYNSTYGSTVSSDEDYKNSKISVAYINSDATTDITIASIASSQGKSVESLTMGDLVTQLSKYGVSIQYASNRYITVNRQGKDTGYVENWYDWQDVFAFDSSTNLILKDTSNGVGRTMSYNETISASTTIGDISKNTNNYYITVSNGATTVGITLNSSTTIDDVIKELANYNIVGSIGSDGILTLEPQGEYFFLGGDALTLLNLSNAEGFYHTNTVTNTIETTQTITNTTTSIQTNYYNTSGSTIKTTQTTKLSTTDVTFGELYGTSFGTNTIVIRNTDGSTAGFITVTASSTIDDLFTALAAYDIQGSIDSDGKVSFKPVGDNYISDTSSIIASVLKIKYASSDLYTVTTNTTYANTTSSLLQTHKQATIKTGTTMRELGLDSGHFVVNDGHGNLNTISINATTTVDDIFTQLAAFDILGTIDSDGKVTFESKGDAYLSDISAGFDSIFKINGPSYITSQKTKYANTDSKTLKEEKTNTITSDTTLGELGGGNPLLQVDGAMKVFSNENTLGDICTWLAAHNISASILEGKVVINDLSGTKNEEHSYLILNYRCVEFLMRLNLSTTQADYITTKTSTTLANTTSDELTAQLTKTMKTSTTLGDLGASGTLSVSFTQDGQDVTLTFNSDDTVDDMLTALAGYGISGQVVDGKLSLTGSKHTFITSISDDLKSALQLGENISYSTVITEGTTVNTDSNKQTYEDANAKITGDTVLSSIEGFQNGNGSLIVHKTDGTFITISVDASKTLDEFFEQISRYGIIGSVDSQGAVTITGVGNAYLQQDTNGSNILTALKLSNVAVNVKTVTVNRTSDTLSHIATVAAKGTTTLENLQDKTGQSINFDSLGKAGLILHAYSDAGNKFATIEFSKTDTIYDIIDKLAEYGIDARLDADGRFSVTSSTLTDFDLLGDIGTFLMGAYTKNYGEDTTHNVSTLLVDRTITQMTDASKLADFGITGGDIRVIQDGKSYTVNVDMTKIKTIGDFRGLLAQYGFNSYIDDAGRLNIIGIGNSTLEQIDGGSNILDRLGLLDWTKGEITQTSTYLADNSEVIRKISMSDKLKDLTNSAGVNLGITAGQIYVYQDGTRSALNIDINDTLETLAAKLSQYGISVGISQDGKLYFDGNNNSYLTTNGLITANSSNILEKFNISDNWSTRYDSTSKNLSYTEDENTKVNGSTKLKDLKDTNGNNLGITTGSFYVYNSGVRNTETITEDTTIDDLKATLAKYGLIADFDENGAMSVGAYNNTYLATSALSGDNSNIVNTLFEQWNFVNIYTSNNLDIPKNENRAITRDTKLADINEGTYQAGFITVTKDGVKTNISLTADDTVGTLMDELALYGFESVINDKGQLMIKNTGDSMLQAYTGTEQASNALELLGIDINNWINTNTYDSKTLDVTQTTTSDVAATRDTLLSELGVSTGEYYIYNNGVKYTAMISSDETLGSFMDTLKSFGIETSLVTSQDGASATLKIVGKGDSYIKKSTSTTNSSNIVEKLFKDGTSETTLEYKGLEQTSTTTVITNAITEDTLVSYFDKPWGNDTLKSAGTLAVVVNGQTNTINIAADETFGSLLEKFRALGLEATLSKDGQIMIQSGYDTMTIKSDGTTSNLLTNISLNYKDDLGGYSASSVTVNSTTTSIEEKTLSVANYANGSTKMDMLNITDGSLTVYDDGRKATIEIKADETFDQLRTRLATAFADLDLTFENGYLKIYSKDGKNVEVGSTTDKGNFGAITGIASDGNGASVSSRELYCVNGDTAITTSGIFRRGNVTEGTFTIGNAVFNIDSTTTLSNLISQINSSEAANATAFWDNVDGKFVIKSRTTGAALVNIEAGTSNFTDILGFTTTSTVDTTDKDGNAIKTQVSKMNINTQEIGDNAKVKINGTTYTSTSNNIGSDVTRIKGLTINLKGLTKDSAVTLKVERDKETLANAVSGVVDSYNELMKNVDEAIASDGDLKNESTLKLIRNQLRNLMTSSDSGTTVFRNLDSIGIGVAAASGSNISTTNSAIVSMTFDKDKFLKAYEADQDAVKDLIIGGANNKGIFTKVEDLVESTLKSVSGYFASTETSYSNKIKDLDKKITKANKEVDRYKTRLEAKFKSMDMLIAQMQQQYSSFLTT